MKKPTIAQGVETLLKRIEENNGKGIINFNEFAGRITVFERAANEKGLIYTGEKRYDNKGNIDLYFERKTN